jgi:hypothetical protein
MTLMGLKEEMGPSRAEKMENFYAEIKDVPLEKLFEEFQ